MTEEERRIMYIGEIVVVEAEERFKICGAEDDFCIQNVGPSSVVFGGYNRVIWNPISGWIPDCGACRASFLRKWDAYFSE